MEKFGKTYEIHTSMSEEMILDELSAMKRKFLPDGKLKAEKFRLLVLAPAKQSGRRRTGGFVSLTGSIARQEDLNCIRVKTGSGVSFWIPMVFCLILAFAVGSAILAGDWKAEFLFPIGFLVVFLVILLCVRKKDGVAAERLMRERFEGMDRVVRFCYRTHYTKEQCLEFMKHDNLSDKYVYEWREEKTFGALIIKDYRCADFIHDFDGRQEWGFIVRFRENPEGTVIEAELVQTEKLPFIHNRAKVDAFWEEKLSAVVNEVG